MITMTTLPRFCVATHDLLSVADLTADEIHDLLDHAAAMKANPRAYRNALAGKSIVLLFEKPSLRTRVSFEIGAARLGASAHYLDHGSSRLGVREPIGDYGRNLSLYADAVVARVFDHSTLESLALSSDIPVINALSDLHHPSQTLADLLTLQERFGQLAGLKAAWVGDGD